MAKLQIYVGASNEPERVVENVNFHLLESAASWSSADFEESNRIEGASVSLLLPSGEAGDETQQLLVSGWAAQTKLDTARWERWQITLDR
jgi:hypothetical protein